MVDGITRAGPERARSGLKEWLEHHGQTASWLARELGYAPATASRWLDDERPMVPDQPAREALEILTGGAVPAAMWRTAEDAAVLERARAARAKLDAGPTQEAQASS